MSSAPEQHTDCVVYRGLRFHRPAKCPAECSTVFKDCEHAMSFSEASIDRYQRLLHDISELVNLSHFSAYRSGGKGMERLRKPSRVPFLPSSQWFRAIPCCTRRAAERVCVCLDDGLGRMATAGMLISFCPQWSEVV